MPETNRPIREFVNSIIQGDCIKVMRTMPSESIDFVLTDPPYLVNYKSWDGRGYPNDDPNDAGWLLPAFEQIYRVLKNDSLCVSFYGYTQADKFLVAWKHIGFRPVAHFTFVKDYGGHHLFAQTCHENAYLLAKGKPPFPRLLLRDVLHYTYSGNRRHPTEKTPAILQPLIRAFTKKGDIVLDPFAGSGSSLVAAKLLNRRYVGIELMPQYRDIAQTRLA